VESAADFAARSRRLLCFALDEKQWRRHTVDDPDFEPDLFLGAYGESGLEAAALGVVRHWKNPDRGFVKFLAAPVPELLAELKRRLFDKGVSEIHFGASAPLYLFPGVPAEDAELLCLLREDGWEILSDRVNLVLDAEANRGNRGRGAPDAENAPFRIRLAESAEKERVFEFVEREFSRSWAVEATSVFDNPDGGLCAIAENTAATAELAGFAAVHASNPNWFGPMGVAKELRGRGLGKKLAVYAAEKAFDKNSATAKLLLPWINEKEPFYRGIFGDMEKHSYKKAVAKSK